MEPQDSAEEYADIRIAAVMSVPMCGWNPHWGCTQEALRPFSIPIRLAYGAYWHQSMSNLLEEALAEGLDWVLTLDYDSCLDAIDVDQIIGTFGRRPEIDALCALQCKRGTEEVPLCWKTGFSEVEINGQPFEVDSAHFGMTLLRLESLRKVPMPWFVSQPNPEGSYTDLRRTDADIGMWHRWKAVGNNIFIDPLCSIGHLQPMVAEFDENYQVRHVHVNDWRKARNERKKARMAP